MNRAQRLRLHGGPSVEEEPHPTTRGDGEVANIQTSPTWTFGAILCGDCGRRLVYGRDGKYRHREETP